MSRWKPEKLEDYFYVDTGLGEVRCFTWEDDEVDSLHHNMGNCFKTEEEAKQALEKIKETLTKCQEEIE